MLILFPVMPAPAQAPSPAPAPSPSPAQQPATDPTISIRPVTPEPITLRSKLSLMATGSDASLNALYKKTATLILSGRPLAGIVTQPQEDDIAGVSENGTAVRTRALRMDFFLDRTEANRKAWDEMLRARPEGTLSFTAQASIAADGVVVRPGGPQTTIQVIRPGYLTLALALSAALGLAVILAGRNTGLLRDALLPEARALPGLSPTLRPYSLAQVQLAIWTVVTLASFMIVYLGTGDLNSFPSSALVLLGISSATALAATTINLGRDDPGKDARIAAAATYRALYSADPGNPALAAPREILLGATTRHFLPDILNEDRAPSVHRLQMLAWTLVLAVLYLIETMTQLSLPDLNTNLLALMGISGGVYLGFKFPTPQS